MAAKNVTHCIFDLDGTIFDTENVHFRAFDEVLQQYGKRHSLELWRKILGRSRQDGSRIIIKDNNLPMTIEEFLRLSDEIADRYYVDSVLLPGVEKVVRHLHAHSIPIAIGTSSSLAAVDLKFTKFSELKSFFHHVVGGSEDHEVHEGKPAPDVFLVAAKRFEPPARPENCLVFEDSPSGVRAGLAAGMQVVMIPDARLVSEEQRREATICLNSMADFEPEVFGLPPF